MPHHLRTWHWALPRSPPGHRHPPRPAGPHPAFRKPGEAPQVVSKCSGCLSKPRVAEQGEALTQLRVATPNTQK